MRVSRYLAAALALSVAAAACAPAPQTPAPSGGQAPAPAAAQPFTLRVGHATLQATLDAHAIIGTNPRRYGVWEMMLNQDENGKLIPGIANEWKNLNATTWQFKLTPNRKFSDGTPVTAQDVKFSWDRAINPDNKFGITGRLGTLDRADIVDATTINLVTKIPDGLLPKRAAAVVIMQKAFTEKATAADVSLKPIGTGAYMVKEFVPSDHLTLVTNPHYPNPPQANEVILRHIPEASARISGLRTGELDIISAVPISGAEQLKSAGMSVVNFNKGGSFGAILFPTLAGSPMANKLVRQAVNYAIDKDSIAKNIYQGYTQPTGQLAQKDTFGYNPDIKPYPYDPAKAKQLLAQAGYPNGFSMKMDVYVSAAEVESAFLFMQSQLKEVGITAEINKSTDPTFNTDRFYGRVARNQWLSQSLNNSPALDSDFSISWFRSARPEAERWFNNADFDAAYEASTVELDEAKREKLLQTAQKVLHEEAPWLYVTDNFVLWGASASMSNVIVRGDAEPRFELITKK